MLLLRLRQLVGSTTLPACHIEDLEMFAPACPCAWPNARQTTNLFQCKKSLMVALSSNPNMAQTESVSWLSTGKLLALMLKTNSPPRQRVLASETRRQK